MKSDSPFLEVTPRENTVDVTFDGEPYVLPDGANLVAALLVAGVRILRCTPVSGAPRAPFCMMGACHDCLVEVDGISVRACMTMVTPGLMVARAHGKARGEDG